MRSSEALDLLDWRRRVFATYAEVRRVEDPAAAWRRWRDVRDELFATHAQSPIPLEKRASFRGLRYFEYDSAMRVSGEVASAEPQRIAIGTSGERSFDFTRFGRVSFELGGRQLALDLYWLESYGGGVFLPFRDTTAGETTYGAGRYLLDTVKGADLGSEGGCLVLDFNFAYNPSCAHDPRWVCPLAPPANRLPIAVRAGERAPE